MGALVISTGLGGCISIKSQSVSQRVPGTVTLRGVICASDYNRNIYPDCDGNATDGTGPANVQESDNLRSDADGAGNGQILVGLRVPVGSSGPASFLSEAGDISFQHSPSYSSELQRLHPASEGRYWVGYISTVKPFDSMVAASRQTAFSVEFTLPPQADGTPFLGPFLWRLVVGFRTADASTAGEPVACGNTTASNFTYFCFDSPPASVVPTSLSAPVSDFGVLPGDAATVAQGATATLSFPVRYLDAGGKGPQDFALRAETDAPGATATPSVATLHALPDSSNTVTVSVPLRPDTPVGTYTVRLSAGVGTPEVVRSNTGTVTVTRPPPPPDTDGDGVPDQADRCPTVKAVFDPNRDGCLGPFPRIDAGVAAVWSARGRRITIKRLRVRDVPATGAVEVRCTGKGCPFKRRKAAKPAKGIVNALKVFGKRRNLRAGQKIEVRIRAPWHIGMVVRYNLQRGKIPNGRVLCVPIGKTRAQKRC